jgi:tetratricopeptide (TPR) repeat protein
MNRGKPAGEDAAVAVIRRAIDLAGAGHATEAIALVRSGRDGVLRHPAGHNVLGALLMQTGRTMDALAAFEAAVAIAPGFADALCNRGVALQKLGRNADALAAYEATLRSAPKHPGALFNRGNVLKLLGRLEDAQNAFDRVLAEQPGSAEAHLQRALVRSELADHTGALSDFDASLRARPGSADAALGRVSALVALRRYGEALAAVDAILALRPDSADAALSRAQILVELDRLDEARALADGLIARNLPGGKAGIVRAAALWRLGRHTEAIAAGEAAMRRDPGDVQAHQALSNFHLALGDFARGWEEYEYRGDRIAARQAAIEKQAPRWAGQDIAGKTVLVFSEQGIGDTIQFVRFLGELTKRGAAVKALVQPPVLKLVHSFRAPVVWMDKAREAGHFDFQIPLLSLPHMFGTRVGSIPAVVPHLSADAGAAAFWRARIGTEGFRVGVVWQGNPAYRNDRRRSVPLRHYAALAAVPDVRLISLQAVHGLDQLQSLPPGMSVETLGERITANPDGISDIAAVMTNLDLIVSSDTAMAHLAGALGRPVWVALSDDPDWRWMLDRNDSPWYPTMRLFRQGVRDEWEGVFAAMAGALAALVPAKAGTQ